MAIPESQLTTWAQQGAVTTSKDTYASIKGVLEHQNSPYYSRAFTTFLQGSYGNDTNVWRDSDVDVVIRYDNAFYHNLNDLDDAARARFDAAYSDSTYGLHEFKQEVIDWLKANYGNYVTVGTKAISIAGSNSRRDADVLACVKYRYYQSFENRDTPYHEGICFIKSDGTRIENFPRQHSQNCTTKHQNTGSYFKHMVRIVKNTRNRMVDDGLIQSGLAPSYFIEGLLYNVPDNLYGKSYKDSFIAAINWVLNCEKEKLTCANGIHWLLRDNRPTSWRRSDCDVFLDRLVKFWNDWNT